MRNFFIKTSKILIVSALTFSFIALFIFYENYDSLIILSDATHFAIITSFLEILQIFNLSLLVIGLLLFFQPKLSISLKNFLFNEKLFNDQIIFQKKLLRSPPKF